MGRAFNLLAGVLLAVGGLAMIGGYAVIVQTNSDPDAVHEAALLGGFGIVALISVVMLFAVRSHTETRVGALSPWISAAAFVALIVAGAISARSDRWPAIDPLLAVAASIAVVAFIAALAMRWAPGKSVQRRLALGTGLWGMVGATSVALVLELLAALALVGGGILGLYLADPELVRRISHQGLQRVIDDSGSKLATTTTVIIGLVALYALLAPMAEEFAKLLGTMIFLGDSTSKFDAFIGGVFAGLGFASVETLAYALAAGEKWPLLIALRAPIALVHVAAASTAALGSQASRSGSRFGIVRGYGLAVLIHGLWNGLVVAVLVISASVGESNVVPPAAGIALAGIIGLMGMHLIGCVVLLLTTARKLGQDADNSDYSTDERPPVGPETYFERTTTLLHASAGSV